MATYALPFHKAVDPDETPARYAPATVLARAMADAEQADAGAKLTVGSPWGDQLVEVRGEGQLMAAVPAAEVRVPSVMVALVAAKLGIPRQRIEATGMPLQVLDLGREVLVVPVDDPAFVEEAPATMAIEGLPGVQADEAVLYARTQRTPYIKVLARIWGEAEPFTALGAAAMHLLINQGVRATYPRTRVVGELVGEEGRLEVALQLKSVGGRPKVERIFLGGCIFRAP